MLEICPSGLMSGIWKRSTRVPPRQISTLHAVYEVARFPWLWSGAACGSLDVASNAPGRFASVYERVYEIEHWICTVEIFCPKLQQNRAPPWQGRFCCWSLHRSLIL